MQIEREKARIYKAFMFVPMSIIKRLSQQSQRRLEMLRNQLENNEVDREVHDFESTHGVDKDVSDCQCVNGVLLLMCITDVLLMR